MKNTPPPPIQTLVTRRMVALCVPCLYLDRAFGYARQDTHGDPVLLIVY